MQKLSIVWVSNLTFFQLFLFLYLGVGSFIKWKFFGAEGVEMIPNWEFWSTLSSNLKVSYIGFDSLEFVSVPCLTHSSQLISVK